MPYVYHASVIKVNILAWILPVLDVCWGGYYKLVGYHCFVKLYAALLSVT